MASGYKGWFLTVGMGDGSPAGEPGTTTFARERDNTPAARKQGPEQMGSGPEQVGILAVVGGIFFFFLFLCYGLYDPEWKHSSVHLITGTERRQLAETVMP